MVEHDNVLCPSSRKMLRGKQSECQLQVVTLSRFHRLGGLVSHSALRNRTCARRCSDSFADVIAAFAEIVRPHPTLSLWGSYPTVAILL